MICQFDCSLFVNWYIFRNRNSPSSAISRNSFISKGQIHFGYLPKVGFLDFTFWIPPFSKKKKNSPLFNDRTSLEAQLEKNLPAKQDTWV